MYFIFFSISVTASFSFVSSFAVTIVLTHLTKYPLRPLYKLTSSPLYKPSFLGYSIVSLAI